MWKKIDSRIKGLLWFLFQPEESPGIPHLEADRRRFRNGQAAGHSYQEVLKSVAWIILSILISLALAHLK